MSLVRCSICEKSFESEASPALPFCSDRCRLLDLGQWLNEQHGLPYEGEERPEEPEEPEDGP